MHRVTDAGRGLAPDLDLLLAPLVVGDDAALVLALDLLGFVLELLEERGLAVGGLDVGDGDGETGPGRELEAEVLELVEALGHDRARVRLHEHARDLGEVALLHRAVLEREVGRERLVEQQATERGLDQHPAVAVAAAARRRSTMESGFSSSRAGYTSAGNRAAGMRTLIKPCSDSSVPS